MNSEDLAKIGARIARRRKELNLTQEQVAERMNASIQMLSNIERGKKQSKLKIC